MRLVHLQFTSPAYEQNELGQLGKIGEELKRLRAASPVNLSADEAMRVGQNHFDKIIEDLRFGTGMTFVDFHGAGTAAVTKYLLTNSHNIQERTYIRFGRLDQPQTQFRRIKEA